MRWLVRGTLIVQLRMKRSVETKNDGQRTEKNGRLNNNNKTTTNGRQAGFCDNTTALHNTDYVVVVVVVVVIMTIFNYNPWPGQRTETINQAGRRTPKNR